MVEADVYKDKKTLRFAVIGVGRMGKTHALNIANNRLNGAKLVAVCDLDNRALLWSKNNLGDVHCYKELSTMLSEETIDAVIIVTPHPSHKDLAITCIEHGIHTLIEKPLTVSVQEAKEVIEIAKKHPEVKVGISYNQRSNPVYQAAKEIISSGCLGQIQRANFVITNWYRSQAYYNQGGWRASYNGEGGGCLINQCIHQIDILQWLIGMPLSIYAECRTIDRNISTENDVTAILHYPNFVCTFAASTHELEGTNCLEIAGDRGKLVIQEKKMTAYFHESQTELNQHVKDGYGSASSVCEEYEYGARREAIDNQYGQQLRSLQAFVDSILGIGSMLATVKEGLAAITLINGMYLSSWKKELVTLPFDSDLYEQHLEEKRQLEKAQEKGE